MNNLTTMEQVWLTMIIWFALLSIIGFVVMLYARYRKKKLDERIVKTRKERLDYAAHIFAVKKPRPERKEILLSEEEYVIPRDKIDEFLRRRNTAGVRKIIFQNGQEIDLNRKAQSQKGRNEKNDDGIILWNTDEKSAPLVSVDFAPPLDAPNYPSDSGSSNNDSSPTDFSGGDFGGGGAGAEY